MNVPVPETYSTAGSRSGGEEQTTLPRADQSCWQQRATGPHPSRLVDGEGIFGMRVSSMSCGHFSDKYGRTKTLMGNCIFMIVGGVVQAGVSNFWLFALGRLIADISPGTATATIGGYINELPPPHMRDTLGLGL
ncbi:hypothetical protein PC116_g27424 [Phytophthora cactorum]|nr:hypothetical protein PC116_g27424 [Phytophthora cactorum]